MSDKPKSKKQGLSDSKIQRTIDTIKLLLPNAEITIAAIRNPTRDMVLSFFSECVSILQQKTSFISGLPIFNACSSELSEEELLYVKLRRIGPLRSAGFMLGDLYKFDPKRVNYHFFITAHFVLSTESIIDNMKQLANKLKEAEESVVNSKQKLDELKTEKFQLNIDLTKAKEWNEKVKEQAKSIVPLYQQTLEIMERNEQQCKHLRVELDKLTLQHQLLLNDIQKHEKTEADLKNLVVTEEEYNKLKETLNAIMKTDQNLEEIDINNGLMQHKQLIKHLNICLKDLEAFVKLPDKLSKLSALRDQKPELERAKEILQKIQNSFVEYEQKITQTQEELLRWQNGNKEFEVKLTKVTEKWFMDEFKLKQECVQQFKLKIAELEQLKESVATYEKNLKVLKNSSEDRCKAMLDKEAETIKLFENFEEKIKEIKPELAGN